MKTTAFIFISSISLALAQDKGQTLYQEGKFDEARATFDDLAENYDLSPTYNGHVKWNRDNLAGRHKAESKKAPITDKATIIAKIMEKRKKDDTGNA